MKKLLARTPLLRMAHLTRIGWRSVAKPVTMGVRALIRDRTGAVLLIRHSYVGGWHMPGGGVDRDPFGSGSMHAASETETPSIWTGSRAVSIPCNCSIET